MKRCTCGKIELGYLASESRGDGWIHGRDFPCYYKPPKIKLTMNYPDEQLQRALVKMLPDTLDWSVELDAYEKTATLCWKKRNPVLPTELLHLCWLVEETLSDLEKIIYACELAGNPHAVEDFTLWDTAHATWQQRAIALAKVKGIEIV